mgnify:CR=1 FL=1
MGDPLDLDAIRESWSLADNDNIWKHASSETKAARQDLKACLAVIEALAAALEASLAVEQVDEEGFITAAWNRAYGDARTALALVTGGKAAVSHHEDGGEG